MSLEIYKLLNKHCAAIIGSNHESPPQTLHAVFVNTPAFNELFAPEHGQISIANAQVN